jgi:hypothetical protein
MEGGLLKPDIAALFTDYVTDIEHVTYLPDSLYQGFIKKYPSLKKDFKVTKKWVEKNCPDLIWKGNCGESTVKPRGAAPATTETVPPPTSIAR